MTERLGVGFIGAGPVTQAIHLPTLATLWEHFEVRNVMDVDAAVAAEVAARAGARTSTNAQEVFDDREVNVVAICSPPQFHAEQVAAACAAGKRAILCEKPLATSAAEASRIAEASRVHGVPVVVGTMHAYDPAYAAAFGEWKHRRQLARFLRSSIFLPPNDDVVALATDLVAAPTPPRPAADLSTAEARAARMRGVLLGLAIHNLPLIRQLLGSEVEVKAARVLLPFGYVLTLTAGERSAQLNAYMPGAWQPHWTLEAWGHDTELEVEFPPSYVLAGSAMARVRDGSCERKWQFPENGYQAEWRHIGEVALGRAPLTIPLEQAVDDLLFALDIADRAAALFAEEQ